MVRLTSPLLCLSARQESRVTGSQTLQSGSAHQELMTPSRRKLNIHTYQTSQKYNSWCSESLGFQIMMSGLMKITWRVISGRCIRVWISCYNLQGKRLPQPPNCDEANEKLPGLKMKLGSASKPHFPFSGFAGWDDADAGLWVFLCGRHLSPELALMGDGSSFSIHV